MLFLSGSAILFAVYFRTKSIKGTPLVQLVESFRNPEGQPRQRILASLGDARLPEAELTLIARAIEDHLLGNPQLLSESPLSDEAASWVVRIIPLLGRSKAAKPVATDKVDGVLTDKIQTENVVQYGPQCIAMAAWNELRLTEMLAAAGLNPAQAATAQLMVANRLNRATERMGTHRLVTPHRPARATRHPHHQDHQGQALPDQRSAFVAPQNH